MNGALDDGVYAADDRSISNVVGLVSVMQFRRACHRHVPGVPGQGQRLGDRRVVAAL
jgi:hypothetical protein